MLWTGDWTGGRVHPWGMDTAPIRKLCWLAGDCTVDQLTCCCPDEYSRRACSCWLRGIDICELQGCWSAALALCADAVQQVDFAGFALCAAVEPARGQSSTILGLGRARRIALPRSCALDMVVCLLTAVYE